MRRRITWEEFEALPDDQEVWANGQRFVTAAIAICKPIFDLLTVEADMPDEPSHPPIPEGWELCTEETYRNGEFKYWSLKRKEWSKPYWRLPVWDCEPIIQPIETKPEHRRFKSWEELQDYWLSGHSAVLYEGKKARLRDLWTQSPPNAHIDTVSRQRAYIDDVTAFAYPEGYDG